MREQKLAKENHRSRVGRERRSRMRELLLNSVLEVYPNGRDGAPAVIDDVIRHAKVARGTFYKYFDSLDQAVTELGTQMAVEMIGTLDPIADKVAEPVQRAATGFQSYLMRAMIDRHWGAFLTHIGLLNGENPMVHQVRIDIQLGIDTGVFTINSAEVAADLLLAAKVEAIQRIVANQADMSYVHEMTAMVLRSFGVPRARAEKVVQTTSDMLQTDGPRLISWWRAPRQTGVHQKNPRPAAKGA